MRSLTFLVLTTSAATTAAGALATGALAQQPDRPEPRARVEVRAAQVRDSMRVRGVSLETEIERLAEQLIMASRQQSLATQAMKDLTTRRVEQENRRQVELTMRRLQTQFQTAARQSQFLRGQLATLCDRNAKPEGYMGITFSATMRADAAASGAEVFRFEENPTVETVEPGSPAESAGVQKGDEIILIGGKHLVGSEIVFTRLLRPGNRLPIRIRRDGEPRDVVLLIKERPPSLDSGCPFLDARVMAAFGEPLMSTILPPLTGNIVRAMPVPPSSPVATGTVRRRALAPGNAPVAEGSGGTGTAVAPPEPMVPSVTMVSPTPTRSVFVVGPATSQMMIAGATIVRPNADLRETFGVKSGVLVLDVARGTPAYTSGLKGGDIILSAGRFTATSPIAIQRAMQSADERQVQLRIIRKQKAQTLVLRW